MPARSVIQIVTNTAIVNSVLAQVTRDLIVLAVEFGVDINDPQNLIEDSMLSSLKINRTTAPADLILVYKIGDEWPEVPTTDALVVKRDLKPSEAEIRIDGEPSVGFYLPEKGYWGPNRTLQMLNRAYPRGNGIANPLVTLLWG